MAHKKFERAHEFIEGCGFIPRVRCGELRAGGQTGEQRQEKQREGQEQGAGARPAAPRRAARIRTASELLRSRGGTRSTTLAVRIRSAQRGAAGLDPAP